MKVGILVEDNYQVLEVWYPYFRLKEEGIDTLFIGTGKEIYKSKEGYPLREELSIQEADVDVFSGVIVPGGYAPDILRRYKEVNTFVKNMFINNRLVAAICHGGWVLISAGIVRGRKVTSFYAIKDDMLNAGGEFTDAEVVTDGKLVTARKPQDLPAFCKKIIEILKGGVKNLKED